MLDFLVRQGIGKSSIDFCRLELDGLQPDFLAGELLDSAICPMSHGVKQLVIAASYVLVGSLSVGMGGGLVWQVFVYDRQVVACWIGDDMPPGMQGVLGDHMVVCQIGNQAIGHCSFYALEEVSWLCATAFMESDGRVELVQVVTVGVDWVDRDDRRWGQSYGLVSEC